MVLLSAEAFGRTRSMRQFATTVVILRAGTCIQIGQAARWAARTHTLAFDGDRLLDTGTGKHCSGWQTAHTTDVCPVGAPGAGGAGGAAINAADFSVF